MKKRFRRRAYYLARAPRGVIYTAAETIEVLPAQEEEEFVVRLPRRRELLSASECAEPEPLRPEAAPDNPEGETPAAARRRLM